MHSMWFLPIILCAIHFLFICWWCCLRHHTPSGGWGARATSDARILCGKAFVFQTSPSTIPSVSSPRQRHPPTHLSSPNPSRVTICSLFSETRNLDFYFQVAFFHSELSQSRQYGGRGNSPSCFFALSCRFCRGCINAP